MVVFLTRLLPQSSNAVIIDKHIGDKKGVLNCAERQSDGANSDGIFGPYLRYLVNPELCDSKVSSSLDCSLKHPPILPVFTGPGIRRRVVVKASYCAERS